MDNLLSISLFRFGVVSFDVIPVSDKEKKVRCYRCAFYAQDCAKKREQAMLPPCDEINRRDRRNVYFKRV